MSDAQAEKPDAAKPENSNAGPDAAKDDSGLNAQQQKEWMALKQKAEQFNKMEQDLATERAKNEQLSRMAYGGGQQATDPDAEAYNQALGMVDVDPVARVAVRSAQRTFVAEREAGLAHQLLKVPEAKRDNVAAIVRASGYQASVQDALSAVTDPETKTLAEKLAELQAENERLKGAKANGTSPASAVPANANADDGRTQETIKRSEYLDALQRGQAEGATEAEKDRARALKQAVGSNKTKFERE